MVEHFIILLKEVRFVFKLSLCLIPIGNVRFSGKVNTASGTLTSMEPVLSSPSPVSPLVDLLPLSPGPETQTLSLLKEMRLC